MAAKGAPFDFTKLEPGDGLRVERIEHELRLSLYVSCYSGGLPSPINPASDEEDNQSLCVWHADDPGRRDRGACARTQLLLEAVARFITTGGSLLEAQDLLTQLQQSLLHEAQFSYPGWCYADGTIDSDGRFTHLWVSDCWQGEETAAVRWVEDSFIDVGTLAQLGEAHHGDDDESDGNVIEAAGNKLAPLSPPADT